MALPLAGRFSRAAGAPPRWLGGVALAGAVLAWAAVAACATAPTDAQTAWKWRWFNARLTGDTLSYFADPAADTDPVTPVYPAQSADPAVDGSWAEIPPPAVWLHTTIYDPGRDRLVVFGGLSYRGPSNEIWELTLSGSPLWHAVAAGSGPSARSMQSAIYDPVGDRMIVFGGYDNSAYQNDVWALSLAGTPTWTKLTPAGTPPSPRGWHTAIYDPVGRRMIVFGGTSGTQTKSDVWCLSLGDTVRWTQLFPAGAAPGARSAQAAILDAPRGRIVYYGGLNSSSQTCSDVWTLSLGGTPAWTQLAPLGTPPAARNGASAIYDPVRQRLVLFAGGPGAPNFNDTWSLSLSGTPTWAQIQPNGTASGRQFHTAAYDPIGDRMLVFGGSNGPILSGTWALSLSATETWTALSGPRRRGHVAVYDEVRRSMVVFGGDDDGALNDTWEFSLGSSQTWFELTPSGTPPTPRAYGAGVYDPRRDRLLVYGGRTTAPVDETWELSFSGAFAWRQIIADGSPPPPRIDHLGVYDPLRRRMIIFGGASTPTTLLADVWALSLSGTPTWTQLFPAGTGPTARGAAAGVYDPGADRVIVFGGYDPNLFCFNDCWSLSLAGTPTWTRLYPTGTVPDPRMSPAVVYDPERDRMLLFGGTDLVTYFSDTWELTLTGTPAWHLLSPGGVAPLSRADHKAIYDPLDHRMVLYGGGGLGGGLLNDIWSLQFTSTVDVAGGPGTLPRVWPAYPNPSRGATRFDFALAAPGDAQVEVFDVTGRQVREIQSGPLPAGAHAAQWDGTDAGGTHVAPGVYFYRVRAGAERRDGKLVIVD